MQVAGNAHPLTFGCKHRDFFAHCGELRVRPDEARESEYGERSERDARAHVPLHALDVPWPDELRHQSCRDCERGDNAQRYSRRQQDDRCGCHKDQHPQAVQPDDRRSSGGHEEELANDQVAVSHSARTPPTEGHKEQVRPRERHQQHSSDDARGQLMMAPRGTERDREIDEPETAAPPPSCRSMLAVVRLAGSEPAQLATCGGTQLPPDPGGLPRRARLDVHRSQREVVRHQMRAVSRRKAHAASAPSTIVHIATTIHPLESHAGAPTNVWPACTSQ